MTQTFDWPVTRALISVSDKTGIVDLAEYLSASGIEILSTGGTAKLLADSGVPVIEVSTHTGFPEIMEGRVKTLHPRIHGGILGRRGVDDEIMAEHDIVPIDLVVVNLYPFEATVARPDCSLEQAIENIDIGGPAMVRATAKNHAHVTIVVDPEDYSRIVQEMTDNKGCVPAGLRYELAVKAFEHTAHYDAAVANYLGRVAPDGETQEFPHRLTLQQAKVSELRYGENPHQRAAFFRETAAKRGCITAARQLQGKDLSFNNIADADAALECVKQFDAPACVIVKHANPCGVAIGDDIIVAYDRAYATDPTSAFGGVIAFNRALDAHTAQAIIERQFVEVVVAPEVAADALEVLAEKRNVRVLACGDWPEHSIGGLDIRSVNGGLLVQDRDVAMVTSSEMRVVSRRAPSKDELSDLEFAWKVAKFVKSNAIVYAQGRQTVGIGAGQMSRVYSARIAGIKAADLGLQVAGSVMASDAFFPFRDGIDAAHEVGITAVVQPGGSMRDEEVIQAADEHGMAMMFTGVRHFRH